jgi:hypothetical protein
MPAAAARELDGPFLELDGCGTRIDDITIPLIGSDAGQARPLDLVGPAGGHRSFRVRWGGKGEP